MRWHEPMLSEIDAWRAAQEDQPERSEAIRRLVERGLSGEPVAKPHRQAKRKVPE